MASQWIEGMCIECSKASYCQEQKCACTSVVFPAKNFR